jgi:hypothetical protein
VQSTIESGSFCGPIANGEKPYLHELAGTAVENRVVGARGVRLAGGGNLALKCCSAGAGSWDSIQAIPFRRSLKLHKALFAGAATSFSFLAPFLRFGPNRSRASAHASFTNFLLPITAPSVK